MILRSALAAQLLGLTVWLAACVGTPPVAGSAVSPAGEAEPEVAEAEAPPLPEETAAEAPPPRAPLPSATQRTLGLAAFRRALELSGGGDEGGAILALDHAAEHLPLMADWANLFAAEAAARLGDPAEVERRLLAVDTTRAVEWGWRALERAYSVAGDTAGALRALELMAMRIRGPARQAEAWARAGDLHQNRDVSAAAAAYGSSMRAAPASRAARAAAAASETLPATLRDRALEGRVWLRHGNVERGTAGLGAHLAAGAATGAEGARLRLELGRALFSARRYREAERHLFTTAMEPAAPVSVAAEALLYAARAQFRDGRSDAARVTFRSVAERFPREPAAARALFTLGDLEHDAGRLGAATTYFSRAAASPVPAAEAAFAAVRLASISLLGGDPLGAAAALDAFVSAGQAGAHTAQVRYWAGRAYQRAGQPEQARLRFQQALDADPVSYYGRLAADRLGSSANDLPLQPEPAIDAHVRADVERALFRIDFLRELALTEAAAFEMEQARAELGESVGALYLIAEAQHARAQPVAAILLGREIQRSRGAWDLRLLRIVYPFPYRELIEAEARRHGLDPYVVAGLIRQESMFNPIAVSPAGAVGLMQVMPGTGQMLARRAWIDRFDAAMLRRPEVNVRLGTLFLADLLRQSGGNRTEAFAAYNAGPNRVARWRAFPEQRDEELFAERIPFVETRDYVRIVNFNARIYRLLYGAR